MSNISREIMEYYISSFILTLSFFFSSSSLHSIMFCRTGFNVVVVVVEGVVDLPFKKFHFSIPRIVLFTFPSSSLSFMDLPVTASATSNTVSSKKAKYFILTLFCFYTEFLKNHYNKAFVISNVINISFMRISLKNMS